MKICVICDNIRSVHNVGSIFRTADAAGVEKIYLCGITPSPLDRFGKVRLDFAKVSLGAERSVPFEAIKTTNEIIELLKKEGWNIIALEQSEQAVSYDSLSESELLCRNIALVLGQEVEGLSKSILKLADHIIEIPMRGALVRDEHHPQRNGSGKESLNVAVAFGVALFGITHQISHHIKNPDQDRDSVIL